MENNKNKKSVKFQGDMLNFYDFIQVFVFTPNHHLKLAIFGWMDGWMNCDFTSFSAVFPLYQDDVRMIMKGCAQWNPVYD